MEINGKEVADTILKGLKKAKIPKKFLGVFLVGDNPASESFVRQKEKTGKELGVDVRIYKLSKEIKIDKLREEIYKIAHNDACGGVVVQLPLSKKINAQYVLNAIPSEKDVDVLGERSLGRFYAESSFVLPPVIGVVKKILDQSGKNVARSKVAVIGRGVLIGRPVALWLLGRASDLTIFTSESEGMEEKLSDYDILISGVGRGGIIKPDFLKRDATFIDFGYDEIGGEMIGDLCTKDIGSKFPLLTYTPTPGGTGPILVSQLFENFYLLNKER
jgi:methylenetetrahydrofolate dehydrogenase (NADP+) / methenyltetrahydrofolate cyclohydrolase